MSVPFLNRSPAQCAWIVASTAPAPAFRGQKIVPGPRVCGAPVASGSSYCPCHHSAAILPGQKPLRQGGTGERLARHQDERTPDLTEIFR